MKRTVTIFILLFLSAACLLAQQNLVPNGSFEEYSECPEDQENHNGQFERVTGWWSPTWGTPDFFHRCNDTLNIPSQGVVGVPNNFWGHQEPFHGDGYVGIVPYEWFTGGQIDDPMLGFAEYIATELILALKPCHTYRFQMRMNLGNRSSHAYTKVGAYFSSELIQTNFSGILDKEAQIVNESPILDSTDWVLIIGEFQAIGNEKFLYIGYFDEPFINDTVHLQSEPFPTSPDWWGGYYYIDSVALYEIGEVEGCSFDFPNVFTPNNDDINDVYSVDFLTGEDDFEFIILNRWGNVITTLNKDNLTWDGTTNGKKCTDGVYFYKYTITKEDGTKLTGNGTIHLMR